MQSQFLLALLAAAAGSTYASPLLQVPSPSNTSIAANRAADVRAAADAAIAANVLGEKSGTAHTELYISVDGPTMEVTRYTPTGPMKAVIGTWYRHRSGCQRRSDVNVTFTKPNTCQKIGMWYDDEYPVEAKLLELTPHPGPAKCQWRVMFHDTDDCRPSVCIRFGFHFEKDACYEYKPFGLFYTEVSTMRSISLHDTCVAERRN